MNEKSRQVVLIYDEITINRSLKFNKARDKIEGYVDYGYGYNKRQPGIEKSVCVFMARNLFSNWKLPIAYAISTYLICSNLSEIICLNTASKLKTKGT